MPASAAPRRHVLLLGAGHAHAEALLRFARRPDPALHLTLLSRRPRSLYSGLLPAVLRGDCAAGAASLDMTRLAAAAGAAFIEAEAEALDLGRRRVLTARGAVEFDALSLDVGGRSAPDLAGATPAKPVERLHDAAPRLLASLRAGGSVAVIGAGPGGSELALALAARVPGPGRVLLLSPRGAVPEAPPRARAAVTRALARAGVEVVMQRAGPPAGGKPAPGAGAVLDAGEVVLAGGVTGAGFLAASGLDCDARGAVRVAPTLRSLSHDFVYACGDCASIEGYPRPRGGVWAARAGAPLARNLRRLARGLPPLPWRPQAAALVIVGLGGRRAVAWRGGWSAEGALPALAKTWLDQRWIERYRRLGA